LIARRFASTSLILGCRVDFYTLIRSAALHLVQPTRRLLLPSAYRGRKAGLCAKITLN